MTSGALGGGVRPSAEPPRNGSAPGHGVRERERREPAQHRGRGRRRTRSRDLGVLLVRCARCGDRRTLARRARHGLCGGRTRRGRGAAVPGVSAPTGGKNRMHLDLRAPAGSDQRRECDRLVALGASVLDEAPDHPWIVIADPEGNEFCILPPPDSPTLVTCTGTASAGLRSAPSAGVRRSRRPSRGAWSGRRRQVAKASGSAACQTCRQEGRGSSSSSPSSSQS